MVVSQCSTSPPLGTSASFSSKFHSGTNRCLAIACLTAFGKGLMLRFENVGFVTHSLRLCKRPQLDYQMQTQQPCSSAYVRDFQKPEYVPQWSHLSAIVNLTNLRTEVRSHA
jgi:hypothetical protein